MCDSLILKVNRLLAGTLALVLIAGLGTPAFAGPPPVPAPGNMIGVEGNGSPGTPGALNIVDQNDGSLTFVGDPITPRGLSGVAIDSSGTVFGSVVGGNNPSDLVIIDPDNGNLLSTVGTITDAAGAQFSIGDLAVQPGTDVLFGIRSNSDLAGLGGILYTIDTSNAQATLIGDTGTGVNGGLGFAPDGTLYVAPAGLGVLTTLDPSNANVLTTTVLSQSLSLDGLGVRSDGTIFGTAGRAFEPTHVIVTIDPDTGNVNTLGSNEAKISDLDFIPSIIVGGEFLPIDSTALILAGAQTFSWMIPVILSGIGIGLFVVSRKSENS